MRWNRLVLLRALVIHEEEQLVFDNWAAEPSPELVALVGSGNSDRMRQLRAPAGVPYEIEQLAVKVVRPGTSNDVDCAR